MLCPHCQQEHSEATRFCPQTGGEIRQPGSCPNCKQAVEPGWFFCNHCGHRLRAGAWQSSPPDGPAPVSKARSPFFQFAWLIIVIGIGGCAILAWAGYNFLMGRPAAAPAATLSATPMTAKPKSTSAVKVPTIDPQALFTAAAQTVEVEISATQRAQSSLPTAPGAETVFTPSQNSGAAVVTEVILQNHAIFQDKRLELWLEFVFKPGDILLGAEVDSYLDNGTLELTLPGGQKKTYPQTPSANWEGRDVWLPENFGISRSVQPGSSKALVKFENYSDKPAGPQWRIALEKIPEVSAPGRYQISWQSGSLRTKNVVVDWNGKEITKVSGP